MSYVSIESSKGLALHPAVNGTLLLDLLGANGYDYGQPILLSRRPPGLLDSHTRKLLSRESCAIPLYAHTISRKVTLFASMSLLPASGSARSRSIQWAGFRAFEPRGKLFKSGGFNSKEQKFTFLYEQYKQAIQAALAIVLTENQSTRLQTSPLVFLSDEL